MAYVVRVKGIRWQALSGWRGYITDLVRVKGIR